MKPHKSQT